MIDILVRNCVLPPGHLGRGGAGASRAGAWPPRPPPRGRRRARCCCCRRRARTPLHTPTLDREGVSSIVTSAAVIPEAVLRVLLSKLSLKSWSSARSSMGRSSPLVMMMGTLLPPALCSGHWALEEAQTGVQCQTAAPASVFAQFNPVWRSGGLASRGRTARLAQHRLQICKVG